ncbi:MAG TPA: serine/threonine transporter SstT, partial [Erwinia sp.]|nr:serine/threonine transporter SstT [Erwinia sp.]
MSIEKNRPGLLQRLMQAGLVTQIVIGLIAGVALAWFSKESALSISLLGTLFVSALKAVAPLLVMVLVIASIANHKQGQKTSIRPIVMLYLLSTFFAAIVAVVFSHLLPQTLTLSAANNEITPPSGILAVLNGLLMSMVSNPIDALIHANYIGILVWAIGLGFAFRHSSDTTRAFLNDASDAVTYLVRIVIRFAPVGILGLVASILASTGFSALWQYAHLLALLLGCMLLMAVVINPILV